MAGKDTSIEEKDKEMTIAVSHPGKMGDALYALPTARLLYGIHGEKIDFYTSDYCAPLTNLIEYQSYINKVVIPADYKIERMDIGCQPWQMPIPAEYTHIFQLGFRGVPNQAILSVYLSNPDVSISIPTTFDANASCFHSSG